jgi:nucleotide-binding universal stress UspA family protein
MPQTTVSPSTPAFVEPAPVRTGPVIVAVGGADARSVLRAARLLAPRAGGAVLAVSVLELLPVTVFGMEPMLLPPGFEEERQAALATQLTKRVQEFAGAGSNWRTSVLIGDPALVLADVARAAKSPLMVMGIGRHRPMDRLLGAETALRTIRRAPCPVLAVHPDLEAPFHDVVVATDFSAASARAGEIVLPLLAADATLHLVHVWEPAATEDTRLSASDEAYVRSLSERFHRFIGLLSVPSGVTVKTATREGKAAERILDFAAAHHADLIVAGRHGLNALRRLLVGSVTSAILRGANRSVLVVPEPAFADADRLRRLLTGTSESTEPADWKVQLEAFTSRNRGRPTSVEVDDVLIGAQVLESGYVLIDVAYDPAERRIELSLGDPDRVTKRVTRLIGMIDWIRVVSDPAGTDLGLWIGHGGGQTVLTFPAG